MNTDYAYNIVQLRTYLAELFIKYNCYNGSAIEMICQLLAIGYFGYYLSLRSSATALRYLRF